MSRAPRLASARRNWGDDDSRTNIMHVDMDAFFVSVELLRHPELRGKPVAVGGQERGVISAASYEARKYGVNSAMPVAQANRLCPGLIILPATHGLYGQVSRRIMKILGDVTPLVEQLSVDEAFLDVSGARKIFGPPTQIAADIRRRIREQEGVAASIGIASTKHVAKIASAHAKPDGVLLIPHDQTLPFLHSLPVGAIWGVGDKTRERLERKGIQTVADLAELGPSRLQTILGQAAGTQLYALAMGHDPRPVKPVREEKSIGREQTFFEPVMTMDEALKVLLYQAHDVGRRLRAADTMARTVAIKVRAAADFSTITRSVTLGGPTDVGEVIYRAAARLMEQAGIPAGGARLLGVRAEQLWQESGGVQLALGDDGRRGKVEAVIDTVRARFGADAAGPGTLAGPKDAPETRR